MDPMACVSKRDALSPSDAPGDATQTGASTLRRTQLGPAEATARRWALKHTCRENSLDDQAVLPALEEIVLLPPALYQAERERHAQRLGCSPGKLDDMICQFSAHYEHELAKLVAPMVPTSDTKLSPEAGGRQKFTEAALQVLNKSGMSLWASREGKAFITLSLKGVTGHYCLEGKAGVSAVRALLNAEAGLFTTKDQLADLVDQLTARAMVSDEIHNVYLRTAAVGGAVYLDLGSSSGRVVRIDHTGWTVIEMRDCPARFWRPAGLLSLPEPIEDDDSRDFLNRIRDFANLPDRTPLHQSSDLLDPGLQADVTLLMTLPSWIRRTGAVPHLALAGRPGSGKTTAARLLRNLVDPQAADVLPAPRNLLDIAVAARNQALLVYDNLSKVPPETADMFCMLATGGAHGARTLYEDGEMTSWSILCPIIMTSVVTDIVSRVDLLDRAPRRQDLGLDQLSNRAFDEIFTAVHTDPNLYQLILREAANRENFEDYQIDAALRELVFAGLERLLSKYIKSFGYFWDDEETAKQEFVGYIREFAEEMERATQNAELDQETGDLAQAENRGTLLGEQVEATPEALTKRWAVEAAVEKEHFREILDRAAGLPPRREQKITWPWPVTEPPNSSGTGASPDFRNQYSGLWLCGYRTGKTEGLPDSERKRLLEYFFRNSLPPHCFGLPWCRVRQTWIGTAPPQDGKRSCRSL
ncbi:hypothetical protein AAII07_31730 [Microvirga sp. 0TCS3.31]